MCYWGLNMISSTLENSIDLMNETFEIKKVARFHNLGFWDGSSHPKRFTSSKARKIAHGKDTIDGINGNQKIS